MSLFGVYSPVAAWLFTLLAPLIVFYFLKLKRPRLSVPSLVFWRQVLADSRVNSPFQRFKRNLLLLLQMLLLIFLCLGAMQPFLKRGPRSGACKAVVIDCSASMAALDGPRGRSRLEAAKEQVRKMIDELPRGQARCIISFAGSARRVAGFTDNKRVLREALDRIEVDDVPGDIEDALRMAQAMGQSTSFRDLLLFSDGNVPNDVRTFDLPYSIDYRRVPPAGPNIGIVALSARQAAGVLWEVLVRVEGSAGADVAATVAASQNGRAVPTETVHVTEESPGRVAFSVDGAEPSSVSVRLMPDGPDSLASDNVAFLDLPAARPVWAYCPPELQSYRHALEALEGVLLFPATGDEPGPAQYDLVITDRADDLHLACGLGFYVGVVPQDVADLLDVDEAGSTIVDWQRHSGLLQHVIMDDIVIVERPRSREGVQETDYEGRGYEVVIYGNGGPLALRGNEAGREAYYLLFHTDPSTLPFRMGFPIIVSNLVRMATQRAGLAEVRGRRTGVLSGIGLQPDRSYGIEGPRGDVHKAGTGEDGILGGVPAPAVGQYVISGDGGRLSVGAALLNPFETGLSSSSQLEFRQGLTVTAETARLKSDRALWRPLAFLALTLLLVEWWYFNRRAGGWT